MPIGHNSADPDFGRIGAEGGEKVHTLTIEEMPSHNHRVEDIPGQITDVDRGSNVSYFSVDNITSRISSDTGGDQPHNNMPPYRVIKYIEFVGF